MQVCRDQPEKGCGDLVLTNSGGVFVIVEVDVLGTTAAGTSSVEKEERYKRLCARAMHYAAEFQAAHPNVLAALACVYTEAGLDFFDNDAGACFSNVTVLCKLLESNSGIETCHAHVAPRHGCHEPLVCQDDTRGPLRRVSFRFVIRN